MRIVKVVSFQYLGVFFFGGGSVWGGSGVFFGASKFVPKKPKEKLSGLDGDMQDCPCEKMWTM